MVWILEACYYATHQLQRHSRGGFSSPSASVLSHKALFFHLLFALPLFFDSHISGLFDSQLVAVFDEYICISCKLLSFLAFLCNRRVCATLAVFKCSLSPSSPSLSNCWDGFWYSKELLSGDKIFIDPHCVELMCYSVLYYICIWNICFNI